MIVELDIGTISALISIIIAGVQLIRWLYNKIIRDVSIIVFEEIANSFEDTSD